jgi:ABC-type phosphate/phosphonate transport system substrate-binding protein
VVTVFQGVKQYLNHNGLSSDYVLYSSYDALIGALARKEIDIAWNTPLAHAKYHVSNDCKSQTLVMRDVDCNVRSVLIVRSDAKIDSVDQLAGKRLILGSSQAAEATVLPLHFLNKEGIQLAQVKIISLEGEVDNEGNPCESPQHVLRALLAGRGDAGVITESVWLAYQARAKDTEKLNCIWTSPPFHHCVFTASPSFDTELAAKFTELMTRMDPKDPVTADVMRFEGTNKWLAADSAGFEALIEAVKQ